MEEIDPPVPSGEVTPPTTVRSQSPATYAPPDVPPSMYMPSPLVPLVLPSFNEAIRIAALKGTVNQMASDIIELMALLRGPNHVSSSSIPPPAYGSMVDSSPWVPPTLAPESDVVPMPAPTHFSATVPSLTHAPEVYPAVALPITLSATFPHPPMTVPIIDPAMLALPPMPVSATNLIYIAPMPTVFPATSTHAPAPITEPFPFLAPQPQISLPHRTPSILNIPYYNPGVQVVVAPEAPPTYILPTAETEQECRMKRMEEMMKALQESDSRYDASYLDLNLFPDMRLPPKIKIPDFDKYDGTTDPKPHLQGYRNCMMPY
ncbi:proline-rich extensin-like protein EPR1 [Punica granatum]|uniref:Proline-rich extensin-like protein EPR1 n=1 Tax=Punica granatum TaxID=22663 RepID=A0A6P8D9G7_PUNGR|nr:proline-rich extensin-like protein EPR1 [Punica granatum]